MSEKITHTRENASTRAESNNESNVTMGTDTDTDTIHDRIRTDGGTVGQRWVRPGTEESEEESVSESEEETTSESLVCPECSGNVIADDEHGETICDDCGLVITEDSVDRGPEWRAFDAKEKDQKSRVGAPTTNTMHDKGLSTNIDWRDRDAYGNSLSSNQRQKMQRLRKWNERFRTRDSKE